MMNKRNILSLLLITMVVGLTMVSCNKKKRKPGHIYAPDMTYSRAYESYTSNDNFANDETNRHPVAGTVARGQFATPEYHAGDSLTVYSLQNPLEITQADLDEGKRLFNIYCAPCHGTGLDGNGPLYASGKYPLAPANLKSGPKAELSSGQYYYTILFGKNMMGSYSAQLDEKRRWQVVAYIKNANGTDGGGGATEAASTASSTDSTAMEASTTTN